MAKNGSAASMQASNGKSEQIRFKKRVAPTYIRPEHVVPCGTIGMEGVTLKSQHSRDPSNWVRRPVSLVPGGPVAGAHW